MVVGCSYLCYQYLLSDRASTMVYVLFAHGLSGLIGIFVETAFGAHKQCQISSNVAILLGLNEICWIINESSSVLYSYLKCRSVIPLKYTKFIEAYFISLFIGFFGCRINIGVLRVKHNVINSLTISEAHSFAFIFWGLADVTVMGLLLYAFNKNRKKDTVTSYDALLIMLRSSLPRLFCMTLNTLCIVVVGFIGGFFPELMVASLVDFNIVLWIIKGSYSIILLLDWLNTKEMIVEMSVKKSPAKMTGVSAGNVQTNFKKIIMSSPGTEFQANHSLNVFN
jgi:uncharacterized membrane protein